MCTDMGSLLHIVVVLTTVTLILQLSTCVTKEEHLKEPGMQEELSHVACPPWFRSECGNSYECNCTCGSSINKVVTCTSSDVLIEPCYCMTVDLQTNTTVVGNCVYSCIVPTKWYSDPLMLNIHTCVLIWKRTGQLCAQCQDGYGPVVHSYSMQCIPCSSERTKDVILFLSASFIPLTVFCLMIIFFRISGTRPPLSTFILVSQVMAAPQYMQSRLYDEWTQKYVSQRVHNNCWKMYETFFGIWNLDFFRSLYPPMCLSPHMVSLQAAFLEYSIGLYPLLVLAVIYVLVKVYDHGCEAALWNCRPVRVCFASFRRNVDIRASLVDAFATFLILSYVKIGYTTFLILQPTIVFTPDGAYKLYVYVDASVEYFGTHHLAYALPALCITIMTIVIPVMLLLLYPLSCFHKCLNFCHLRCLALHTFADAFQGCYKDGTNGTRDYRWFSVVHLLMRFGIVAAYDLTRYYAVCYVFMLIFCSFYLVVAAIVQPYKDKRHFKIDMVLSLALLMWVISSSQTIMYRFGDRFDFGLHVTLLVVSCLIQFTYFSGLMLHWLLVVKMWHKKVLASVMMCFEQQNYILLD